MCTVSFVKSNDKIIITSNRDEQVLRPAIEPRSYLINGKQLTFPKDPKAGGTWFAIDENGTVLVLLNGATQKHIWNPPYRKSRGLIVLHLISDVSAIKCWETIALEDIEPFTLVLYEEGELYQLQWDGQQKTCVMPGITSDHIWSSATLYPLPVREQRAAWFNAFLATHNPVSETEMFGFHQYTEGTNTENGLVINRNDTMKTLSITQVVIEHNELQLAYIDLINQKSFSNSFTIA